MPRCRGVYKPALYLTINAECLWYLGMFHEVNNIDNFVLVT